MSRWINLSSLFSFQVRCDNWFRRQHYERSETAIPLDKLESAVIMYKLCHAGRNDTASSPTSRHSLLRVRYSQEKQSRENAVPHDYVLKHQEVYTYFDKRSKKHEPTQENRFYHVNINCVRACQ
jgi:hypothetical protein